LCGIAQSNIVGHRPVDAQKAAIAILEEHVVWDVFEKGAKKILICLAFPVRQFAQINNPATRTNRNSASPTAANPAGEARGIRVAGACAGVRAISTTVNIDPAALPQERSPRPNRGKRLKNFIVTNFDTA